MPDGDMTTDNSFTYTYDAENRIRSADVGGTYYCYIYDGNGLRVEKATASSSACSSPTGHELYWRNTAGNTIAETDGSGSTTNSSYNEYVFFAGRRIAQSNPSSSTVNYYFVDHLGSTRVVTTATGSACWEADYYPYGQEKTPASFSDTCSTHYKFTGYERDPETDPGNGTGNDYAFARYYSPRLGRFMSTDPWGGDITDPQTLNKYAYVRNNPMNSTDPSGMLLGPPNYNDIPDFVGFTDIGMLVMIPGSCDITGPCNMGATLISPAPPPQTPAQQKKKSTTPPNCTLNFYIGSNSLLDSSGQAALQGEINRLFNNAGVGVAFVGSPSMADFSVGLGIATSNSSVGGDNLNGTNFGTVFVGNILSNYPQLSQTQLGTYAGQIAGHEFGHFLYPGQGHVDPSLGLNAYNIMKPAGSPSELLDFTPAQGQDIQNKCKQLHS